MIFKTLVILLLFSLNIFADCGCRPIIDTAFDTMESQTVDKIKEQKINIDTAYTNLFNSEASAYFRLGKKLNTDLSVTDLAEKEKQSFRIVERTTYDLATQKLKMIDFEVQKYLQMLQLEANKEKN